MKKEKAIEIIDGTFAYKPIIIITLKKRHMNNILSGKKKAVEAAQPGIERSYLNYIIGRIEEFKQQVSKKQILEELQKEMAKLNEVISKILADKEP